MDIEDLKKQGIIKGDYVKVILKDGAIFDRPMNDIIDYSAPKKDNGKPSPISVSGHFRPLEEKLSHLNSIQLVPAWDEQINDIPKGSGCYLGSVVIETGAIYSCAKR